MYYPATPPPQKEKPLTPQIYLEIQAASSDKQEVGFTFYNSNLVLDRPSKSTFRATKSRLVLLFNAVR